MEGKRKLLINVEGGITKSFDNRGILQIIGPETLNNVSIIKDMNSGRQTTECNM